MESVGGNFNFPLFDHVAKLMRSAGIYVFNPADYARNTLGPLEKIQKMDRQDLKIARRQLIADEINWIMCEADAVLMLAGWKQSLGARAEFAIAQALDIEVREAPNIVLNDFHFDESTIIIEPVKMIESKHG
jgi:hypothetical protein